MSIPYFVRPRNKKKTKRLIMWQIRGEASIGVSGYANASHLFEGPASTSLS